MELEGERYSLSDVSLEAEGTGTRFQKDDKESVCETVVESHGSPDFQCQMKLMGEDCVDSPEADKAPTEGLQGPDEGQIHPNREHTEQENGALEGEMHNVQPTANEIRTGTGYLDSVISSIQLLTCSQQDADKDTVQISRAELTLIVEQTLAAQTMCNYMQDLEQKNRTLNKQNEVLKDRIVQARRGETDDEKRKNVTKSLPAESVGTKAQIFQFPGSLPPLHVQLSSLHGHQLQTDDELTSTSLQLPSQIHVDGDTSLNKEVSASGKTSHHFFAMNNAASGASVPSHGASMQNIPHDSVFGEARCSSWGPQQCDESVVGSAGVSQEQHKRALDELEKTKLLLHKITGDGYIHPDNVQELVNLRGKVQNLQEENVQLKIELQNKPKSNSVGSVPVLKAMIEDLKEKIQGQAKREDELHKLITKLGTENQALKQGTGMARPLSQPPSSVGLPGLSHIPSTGTVGCQTDESSLHVEKVMRLNQIHLANLNDQARKREEELMNKVKNLQSQLVPMRDENAQLKRFVGAMGQERQELVQDRDELTQQMIDLNNTNEEQKKKLSHEAERITKLEKLYREAERNRKQERVRNEELEKMIDDERRRYARDEKELLDRVKMLTEMNKDMDLLKSLILIVDQAREEGCPLPQDCANHISALRRQHQHHHHANAAIRLAGSQPAVSGPVSGSRFPPPHSVAGGVQAGHCAAGPQRPGSSQSGHSSGRGAPVSANSSPREVVGPYVSHSLPQPRRTEHQ